MLIHGGKMFSSAMASRLVEVTGTSVKYRGKHSRAHSNQLICGAGAVNDDSNTSVSGLTVDDIVKINNLKKAWAFILDTLSYDFDVRYLRAVNGFVQAGLTNSAGSFRTFDVGTSGTSWKPELPSIDRIEEDLDRIRTFGNPTERSLALMLVIMRGQYFEDGNKRTAQILANHEMIKNGCGIIAVPPDKKDEFGLLLVDYYVTGDGGRIKPFLHDFCISGYDRTIRLSEDELNRQREDDLKHIFAAVNKFCPR